MGVLSTAFESNHERHRLSIGAVVFFCFFFSVSNCEMCVRDSTGSSFTALRL